MIHSARPIVTPAANIVFCCFVSLGTDGQHVRDFELAEWIKNFPLASLFYVQIFLKKYFFKYSHDKR